MINQMTRQNPIYRTIATCLVVAFFANTILPPTISWAQVFVPSTVANLPIPGSMVQLTPAFNPPMVQGMTVYPQNPLEFDFIVSQGEEKLQGDTFKEESKKLIKYFLAALTTPENELWVNLSPYEKERIIPQSFGQTEMGRDLLAQDYILKQLSASLVYPEDQLGKKFWERVYAKAQAMYGTTEIPMNTFNKIWIVPQKAVVYQHNNSVFVVESHLKVMLEEDYVALQKNLSSTQLGTDRLINDKTKIISGVTSQVVRDVLIPEIEKEVNTGKTFANLRQIFNSMILATWYKQNLKAGLLGQAYADQNKIKGIDVADKQIKEKIYQQYVAALKKGVYDYIKEDYDPVTKQSIPKKYFSGGVVGNAALPHGVETVLDAQQLTADQATHVPQDGLNVVQVSMDTTTPKLVNPAKTSPPSNTPSEGNHSFAGLGVLPILGQSNDSFGAVLIGLGGLLVAYGIYWGWTNYTVSGNIWRMKWHSGWEPREAAEKLGKYGDARAIQPLFQRLHKDSYSESYYLDALAAISASPDEMVNGLVKVFRARPSLGILMALEELGDSSAIGVLREKKDFEPIRIAQALKKLGVAEHEMLDVYRAGIKKDSVKAAQALAALNDKDSIPALLEALSSSATFQLEEALVQLGATNDQLVESYLKALREGISTQQRAKAALNRLGATHDQMVGGYIQAISVDHLDAIVLREHQSSFIDKQVLGAIVELTELADNRANPALIALLGEYTYSIDREVINTLTKLGEEKIVRERKELESQVREQIIAQVGKENERSISDWHLHQAIKYLKRNGGFTAAYRSESNYELGDSEWIEINPVENKSTKLAKGARKVISAIALGILMSGGNGLAQTPATQLAGMAQGQTIGSLSPEEKTNITELIRMLDSPSFREKEAADALIKIGEPAVEPLINVINSGPVGSGLLDQAANILARIGDPRGMNTILKALEGGRFSSQGGGFAKVDDQAVYALSSFGEPVIPLLIKEFENEDPKIRYLGSRGLINIGVPAVPALREAAKSDNANVRQEAISTLQRIGVGPNDAIIDLKKYFDATPEEIKRDIPVILENVRKTSEGLSINTCHNLIMLGQKKRMEDFVQQELLKFGPKVVTPLILTGPLYNSVSGLGDQEAARQTIANVLNAIGDPATVSLLIKQGEDGRSWESAINLTAKLNNVMFFDALMSTVRTGFLIKPAAILALANPSYTKQVRENEAELINLLNDNDISIVGNAAIALNRANPEAVVRIAMPKLRAAFRSLASSNDLRFYLQTDQLKRVFGNLGTTAQGAVPDLLEYYGFGTSSGFVLVQMGFPIVPELLNAMKTADNSMKGAIQDVIFKILEQAKAENFSDVEKLPQAEFGSERTMGRLLHQASPAELRKILENSNLGENFGNAISYTPFMMNQQEGVTKLIVGIITQLGEMQNSPSNRKPRILHLLGDGSYLSWTKDAAVEPLVTLWSKSDQPTKETIEGLLSSKLKDKTTDYLVAQLSKDSSSQIAQTVYQPLLKKVNPGIKEWIVNNKEIVFLFVLLPSGIWVFSKIIKKKNSSAETGAMVLAPLGELADGSIWDSVVQFVTNHPYLAAGFAGLTFVVVGGIHFFSKRYHARQEMRKMIWRKLLGHEPDESQLWNYRMLDDYSVTLAIQYIKRDGDFSVGTEEVDYGENEFSHHDYRTEISILPAKKFTEEPSISVPQSMNTSFNNSDMKPGGIDLNPALWDLKIRRDQKGIPLPLPISPALNLHIEGLTPVILNVLPMLRFTIIGFTGQKKYRQILSHMGKGAPMAFLVSSDIFFLSMYRKEDFMAEKDTSY